MNLIVQRGQAREYREEGTGIEFFSVTQVRRVIHDPYAGIPAETLETARVRGQRLHTRFWKVLAARGGYIERPAVLPEYKGYCRAMDTWADVNHVLPVLLEEKGVNRKLGYAGQIDAKTLYSRRKTPTLVDLKTGEPSPTDPMQLLAYNEIKIFKSQRLLDLYIREDGTYVEVWVTVKDKLTEWPAFLHGLNVLKWRQHHGQPGGLR
jgi:hypothetical protein